MIVSILLMKQRRIFKRHHTAFAQMKVFDWIDHLQDDILTWSSSIEVADRYAAYLTTGYVNDHSSNFPD
jgi:hypothetical protein